MTACHPRRARACLAAALALALAPSRGGALECTLNLWGAGGAGGYGSGARVGGAGGFTTGVVDVELGRAYLVVVGEGGETNECNVGYGGQGQGTCGTWANGNGGGLAGLFNTTTYTQSNALLIAGAGGAGGNGGGTNAHSDGGAGGGLSGTSPGNCGTITLATGGTQSAGGSGAAGQSARAGSALQGGDTGYPGGGGGGGYYGGGGGGYTQGYHHSGGAGGSGFVHSSLTGTTYGHSSPNDDSVNTTVDGWLEGIGEGGSANGDGGDGLVYVECEDNRAFTFQSLGFHQNLTLYENFAYQPYVITSVSGSLYSGTQGNCDGLQDSNGNTCGESPHWTGIYACLWNSATISSMSHTLTFDFGHEATLSGMRLWRQGESGYNCGRDWNGFNLYTSSDGSTSNLTKFLDEDDIWGNCNSLCGYQDFTFSSKVKSRYVVFELTDNYDNSQYMGAAELRFIAGTDEPGPPPPTPSPPPSPPPTPIPEVLNATVTKEAPKGIRLDATTNEPGTVHFIVLRKGATAPTDDDVRSGGFTYRKDEVLRGTLAEVTSEAGGSVTGLVSGLGSHVVYDVYFAVSWPVSFPRQWPQFPDEASVYGPVRVTSPDVEPPRFTAVWGKTSMRKHVAFGSHTRVVVDGVSATDSVENDVSSGVRVHGTLRTYGPGGRGSTARLTVKDSRGNAAAMVVSCDCNRCYRLPNDWYWATGQGPQDGPREVVTSSAEASSELRSYMNPSMDGVDTDACYCRCEALPERYRGQHVAKPKLLSSGLVASE